MFNTENGIVVAPAPDILSKINVQRIKGGILTGKLTSSDRTKIKDMEENFKKDLANAKKSDGLVDANERLLLFNQQVDISDFLGGALGDNYHAERNKNA